MNKKIGFIGAGNMASAMIGGIINSNFASNFDIFVSNPTNEKLQVLNDKYKINVTNNNLDIAKMCDIIILSVKPNMYEKVSLEIKDLISKDKIIVTIAAGITINYMEKIFDRDIKIVRTMPNTPSLVLKGVTSITPNSFVTKDDLNYITSMFKSFGSIYEIPEKLMDICAAIGGSSPAFTFMYMDAMADAAVLHGLSKNVALEIISNAILGSAFMVLSGEGNPSSLKDQITSPGGTTIEGVYALEKNNFRHAVMSSITYCMEKSEKLKNNN